ncbi:Transferase [Trema orientale]|uniref:Transferase n=1 Tax=Trema orientale TaxID=63057 RepID=A0A2P5BJA6_TREOI|nr:Transferase [Trema orientale]
MKGEDRFSVFSDLLSQIESIFSMERPDIFGFTRWNSLFSNIDFGWGKPFWVGVIGKAGPAFRNLVVFMDSQWGKGIAAWITLEAKQMAVLENDKEFLAFASLNLGISSLQYFIINISTTNVDYVTWLGFACKVLKYI